MVTKPPEPQFLYLTTTGWKSGRKHRIEIWFVEYENKFYILSEGKERAHWIKNIMHNPRILFSVGDKTFEGSARIMNARNEQELSGQIKELMNAKYKWSDGLIAELAPRSPSGGR